MALPFAALGLVEVDVGINSTMLFGASILDIIQLLDRNMLIADLGRQSAFSDFSCRRLVAQKSWEIDLRGPNRS